ncbi:MAG: hypothetical protein GX417_10180 [Clostridiales bacterium]|nr:hypothetical protein [Clostridiales bacterium]
MQIRILLVAAAFLIALGGCAAPGGGPTPTEVPAQETNAPVTMETLPPSPTVAVSPTPEPEMLIDEDGDITLRSDIAAQFTADTYPFDHKPVVLIYHTHATESYLLTEEDDYVETEKGRTTDTRYNVVAVGEALKVALEARGFTVIHDTTDVEGDDIASAYSRSLAVMQQYDSVDLYLDLHRNASNQRGRSDNTIWVDSVPYAKLFFVVGTGIGTYEGEYDDAPDWKNNYTFALSLMQVIAAKQPDLIKPIRLNYHKSC